MSTGNSTAWDWVPLKSLLVEVKEPVEVLDDHVYDLVSVRRRNGGVFHREALPGRKILTKKLNRAYPNTFLIARMQVVHGACAVVSERFRNSYISDSYLSYKPKPELHLGFMDWLSRTPLMYDHFLKSSHGVIIEKMTFDEDEWLRKKIPLPPLPEQKKIAEILSSVDNLIEKTERLIAKLKELKKAMLQELLTKGIGHTKFKESPVGRIPEEWEVVRLQEIVDFLDELRRPVKSEDRIRMQGRFRYFGASGIIDYVNDFIFEGTFVLLGEDGENIVSRRLPLAFVVSGRIWVNNHAHVIRAKEDIINVHFLALLLESQDFSLMAIGSAQPKLNKGDLEKMRLSVPPIKEQLEIVSVFKGLDQRLGSSLQLLEAYRNLKSALMQDLLTGKVRVKV